jgi:hypothetical protein
MRVEVDLDEDDVREHCTALHCEDEHPPFDVAIQSDRDVLREALRNLIEGYHRLHDERFPWSLCSRDVCRETAEVFGLRP